MSILRPSHVWSRSFPFQWGFPGYVTCVTQDGMVCDRISLLVWQGLPALPLSIRQEFGTSQLAPSLFCTLTAPLKDSSISSLAAESESGSPRSRSGSFQLPELSWECCSHIRAQLGELLGCTAAIPARLCSGRAEMLVLFLWHHLCGNFPASFILFIDSCL